MRRPKGFSIGAPWVFRVARQSGRDSGKAEWRRQWQDRQTVSVCCVRRGEKISFQYSLGLFCFCFRLCFCFGGLFWIEIQSAKLPHSLRLGQSIKRPRRSLGHVAECAQECGRGAPNWHLELPTPVHGRRAHHHHSAGAEAEQVASGRLSRGRQPVTGEQSEIVEPPPLERALLQQCSLAGAGWAQCCVQLAVSVGPSWQETGALSSQSPSWQSRQPGARIVGAQCTRRSRPADCVRRTLHSARTAHCAPHTVCNAHCTLSTVHTVHSAD